VSSPAKPARNRVTPMGDIEAFALRGAWTSTLAALRAGYPVQIDAGALG